MHTIYQVDDKNGRGATMRKAIGELKNPFYDNYRFLHCDTEDKYNTAAESLAEDASDKIVLLDLGFRNEAFHEQMWEAVKSNLTSLAHAVSGRHHRLVFNPSEKENNQTANLQLSAIESTDSDSDEGARIIQDSRLDGISLLGSIGGKDNNSKTLVIVVSQAAPNDLPPILAKIQTRFTEAGWTNLHLEVAPLGMDVQRKNDANHLLVYAKKRWKELFPTIYPPEPRVEKMIAAWLEEYGTVPEKERSKFCSHGQPGVAFTIEGSPSIYRKILQSVFGLDGQIATGATDPELKAIFQMESHDNAYLNVGSRSLGYGKNLISSALLASVIGNLSEMKVKTTGAVSTRVPCQPGFPFLASLLVLFTRMQQQDDGMLDTDSPILLSVAESGPNRISLPLKRIEHFEWKIANKWKDKVEKFPTEIAPEPENKGGVCPALWDVLEARIRGVRLEETSDVEVEQRLIEGKKQLLKVFDGPGRVVAGISFGPYYIHIHW